MRVCRILGLDCSKDQVDLRDSVTSIVEQSANAQISSDMLCRY